MDSSPHVVEKTHHSFVVNDGTEIYFKDWGTGQPMVFSHGWPLNSEFMMAGAVPNTSWLNGCLALDDKSFVKTGPDISSDELANALARGPYLLETNRPRIFALGDVRGGNVKRVASAVGEGSIAIARWFIKRFVSSSDE